VPLDSVIGRWPAGRRVLAHLSGSVHRELAAAAAWRWERSNGDRRRVPWPAAQRSSQLLHATVCCNICGWRGPGFLGVAHSESALCPCCGSVARDRFLHWCWTRRVSYDRRAHVLETSPRMSSVDYRARMSGLVDYLSSDFDGGQHSAMVSLDLQQNWLRTASLDVVLSAHVLEHLPDPGAALDGLYRVLRPGGCLLLQVPLPQGVTGRQLGPEYHGDSTLVHWRFGWDLIDLVRAAGFRCTYLVVEQLRAAAAQGGMLPAYAGDDCDVPDLLSYADSAAMTVVADLAETERHGFHLPFQMITVEARR
jgi:SAM-dependent methyltransferase